MIHSIFHKGSGLGNQLHRYVATRVLAEERGYEFSMIAPENFKGSSFLNLDMGNQKDPINYVVDYPSGKVIPTDLTMSVWEEKTNYYNPEFNFIEDNTVIDGEFQDLRYFERHLDKIPSWLNIREDLLSGFYDDVCVIGFRGGEYQYFPDLFLTQEYWDAAIAIIQAIKPDIKFKVVTDDPETARKFFPQFPITHEMADDWSSILMAKYLIIANSSFYIFPALLNKNAQTIIAPRYWARRNTKEWSMPQNYYPQFFYI